MKKVIFRRIAGRIIPINKNSDRILKSISDREEFKKYTGKGLEKMIDDLPNSSALIHDKANKKFIAQHLFRTKDFNKFKERAERLKKFIRENRK